MHYISVLKCNLLFYVSRSPLLMSALNLKLAVAVSASSLNRCFNV